MRKLISDFAIILTILIFCGVDAFVGVNTPKLIVPSEFKVPNPYMHRCCSPKPSLTQNIELKTSETAGVDTPD